MTDGIKDALGDLEAFRSECRGILNETSLTPQERLYALFLRGVEREEASGQKGIPGPVAAVFPKARGALSGGADLKVGLIRGVFLTALEAALQPTLPGAFAQVSSILRLALGWGTFSAPTIGGEIDIGVVSRVTIDWGAPEAQSVAVALLDEWLKEPERFSRLGLIRGMGSLVVSFALLSWYARGFAAKEAATSAGRTHLDRSCEVLKKFLAGGTEAPMEKLMETGLFAVFFDSLLGRPPVVAALAALL